MGPYPVCPEIAGAALPGVALSCDRRTPEERKFILPADRRNDGVFCDPLHDLVLRHNLSGLLVEPLRNLFERLKANYAGQPGIAFERCAIGRTDGEAALYRARPHAPVPQWVPSYRWRTICGLFLKPLD